MQAIVHNSAIKHYNQQFPEVMRTFACAEVLANSAYQLSDYGPLEPNHVVTLLEADGGWSDYHATALNLHADGFVGYVYTPLNPDRFEMKIVFRGTYDFAGVLRDFELSSPGADSFALEQTSILEQIETIAQERFIDHMDGIHVTVCGHSLGASDAENMSAALTHERAQGGLNWMEGMTVYSLNSPGIPKDVALQSVEDLAICQAREPDFKVDVHFGKAFYDAIQQLGDSHYLAGVSPENAYIEVLEIDKNYYMQTIQEFLGITFFEKIFYFFDVVQAHALETFFSPNEEGQIVDHNYTYHFYTNETAEGNKIVQMELEDKAFSLLEVVRFSLSTMHNAYDWWQSEDTIKHKTVIALHDVLDFGNDLFSSLVSCISPESESNSSVLPLHMPPATVDALPLEFDYPDYF